MIPAIDLARAEERQRFVSTQRQSHRDCLKTIEVEDQALKMIIKAGRMMEQAIDRAPAGLLADLSPADLVIVPDLQPELVVVQEPPVAFTPALDYLDSPDTPLAAPPPAVAKIEPAEPLAPPPPSAPAIKLHARIMDAFLTARVGNMASIEAEDLYRTVRSTAGQVQRAVKALEKEGRIKVCKPSKQYGSRSGCFTVLIKDAPTGEGA